MAIISDLLFSPTLIPWSLIPVVFVGLWALICIDFKNFPGSKLAYSVYSAEDPINCYQNYKKQEANKIE